jgi:predicted metal-dependent phosphoesterase TrpH
MYKLDLHTHSVASPDGGLTAEQYQTMLSGGGLNGIAVTDHDTIAFALELKRTLGDDIIVGEEIAAQEGELIGLFLHHAVPGGLSAADTVQAIHAQGGLVYLPHPFETVRKGVPLDVAEALAQQIDIVETHNGRAVFQNQSAAAKAWATGHKVATAASSDAHGAVGWGRAYSMVAKQPDRTSLLRLLQTARYETGTVGARGLVYPKLNRLKKRLRHG